mgnify:FL=1
MPTILSHAAVPLVVGYIAGGRRIPGRLLMAGVAAAMLPDADVALHLFIDAPWGSPWRHRGFTHSIAFALAIGLLGAMAAGRMRARPLVAFCFLAACTASHGMLDALTAGGGGLPFLWPVTEQRWAFPWRPIEVSPIGLRALTSERLPSVLRSELRWIWLPAVMVAVLFRPPWRGQRSVRAARSGGRG